MEIRLLNTTSDGIEYYEIETNEIPYHALVRCIRSIPGARIKKKSRDWITDDTYILVTYKNATIILETPFSDYVVSCPSSNVILDEFIRILRDYSMKWWEHFF